MHQSLHTKQQENGGLIKFKVEIDSFPPRSYCWRCGCVTNIFTVRAWLLSFARETGNIQVGHWNTTPEDFPSVNVQPINLVLRQFVSLSISTLSISTVISDLHGGLSTVV